MHSLSDTELEIIIAKLGGRSDCSLGRPGQATALDVIHLLNKLEDEREHRKAKGATE